MGCWLVALRGRPVMRDGTEKTDPMRQLSSTPVWFNNLEGIAFKHNSEVLSVDQPPPSAEVREASKKRDIPPDVKAAVEALGPNPEPRKVLDRYTDGMLRLECLDRGIDPSSLARAQRIDALLRDAGINPTPEPPRYPPPPPPPKVYDSDLEPPKRTAVQPPKPAARR